MKQPVYHIAIFASGKGSNAEKIIDYFAHHPNIKVCCVLSNKRDAGVLDMASSKNIFVKTFNKQELENSAIERFLIEQKVDYIILAGFLLKIPQGLIKSFPDKIINIHPSLLPKYGGKGMYGINVHKAVVENKENESGISIHLVNEEYDKGRILLQEKCAVSENDTAEDLAKKIRVLEHKYFAPCIEQYILQNG